MTMPLPAEKVPSDTPPPFLGPAVLVQTWRDLLYVHWPVPPASVAQLFPTGTRPDTLDGRTYVGIVGLTMTSTRLGGVLGIGPMNELNVRLYSVDDAGRQGIVFLSMDVSRPDAVFAARLSLQLPYWWSHISPIRTDSGVAGFQLRRRVGPRLTARVEVEIGDPIARPANLEVFLTARWGLHTRTVRGTTWVPVTHAPFRLHRAGVLHADKELLVSAGVPMPDDAPVGVLWSPGLAARIGRPQRLAVREMGFG
jgi:uncharacterized protein YqjF (DUF2071 family)